MVCEKYLPGTGLHSVEVAQMEPGTSPGDVQGLRKTNVSADTTEMCSGFGTRNLWVLGLHMGQGLG